LRPEVPENLQAIVEKMMAKDPKKRYQNLTQVIQDLAPWAQKPIPLPPEKEMPKLSPAAQATAEPSSSTKLGSSSKVPLPPTPPVPAPVQSGGAFVWAAVGVLLMAAVGVWCWWTFLRHG
jgi:serine/threonine protein kinase